MQFPPCVHIGKPNMNIKATRHPSNLTMNKFALLALASTFLVVTVTAKTIGIKYPASDEELEREDEELYVSPEFVTEAMLASQLLAQEYEKGLKEKNVPERDLMTSALEASFPILDNEETAASSHRSKRTIGFMARLGHCIFTFMSNPNCWSRLTRNQIYRAQKQEREQKEQDQMRFGGTTHRPRLLSSVFSTVRNTMGAFFPRLFNRHHNNDDSQPSVSRITMSLLNFLQLFVFFPNLYGILHGRLLYGEPGHFFWEVISCSIASHQFLNSSDKATVVEHENLELKFILTQTGSDKDVMMERNTVSWLVEENRITLEINDESKEVNEKVTIPQSKLQTIIH
ncbi:unnamed protein product [Allacma fusca]|uniref:Uncharacterized protein n=1 Tax=Allacma fusca TaxID=39272 RepID=A0A8J2NT97_9HEXA|nr:unnamed protein product [Allacma fusca]